ncbi:MAG: DUF3313 family protein [Rhodospirillaceae bacterium]|nr:DUF3313 family protein [Rhodospirillaceae bacterium]
MRRSLSTKVVAAAFTLVFLCPAYSSAQPALAAGDDAEVTPDGLHRVDPAVMGAAWVQPDLDLSHYDQVLFWPTAVQFREVREIRSARSQDTAEAFPVGAALEARLRESFAESFHDALSGVGSYELTEQPGRNVLLIRALLTDVISGVPPDSAGSTLSTVRWAWEATLVLEIRDSMSDEVLARTADRNRVDGPFDAALVGAITPNFTDGWSQTLVQRLDEVSEVAGGGGQR